MTAEQWQEQARSSAKYAIKYRDKGIREAAILYQRISAYSAKQARILMGTE